MVTLLRGLRRAAISTLKMSVRSRSNFPPSKNTWIQKFFPALYCCGTWQSYTAYPMYAVGLQYTGTFTSSSHLIRCYCPLKDNTYVSWQHATEEWQIKSNTTKCHVSKCLALYIFLWKAKAIIGSLWLRVFLYLKSDLFSQMVNIMKVWNYCNYNFKQFIENLSTLKTLENTTNTKCCKRFPAPIFYHFGVSNSSHRVAWKQIICGECSR